jgi:hypothetical protein
MHEILSRSNKCLQQPVGCFKHLQIQPMLTSFWCFLLLLVVLVEDASDAVTSKTPHSNSMPNAVGSGDSPILGLPSSARRVAQRSTTLLKESLDLLSPEVPPGQRLEDQRMWQLPASRDFMNCRTAGYSKTQLPFLGETPGVSRYGSRLPGANQFNSSSGPAAGGRNPGG